ncbi:MAG: hypothetical protein Kow0079_13490 [Vicingaceae bacterium]
MNKIVGVELSHRFAPISVREKLALNKAQTQKALNELKNHFNEVVIISTCNRLSVYAVGNSHHIILDYFDKFGDFRQYFQIFPDSEIAVRNLFSTASGLESQAIGEHQIIGQIKDGLELARKEKVIGPILDQLIRQSVFVGKRVRLETNIGKYSASLATVGYELILKHQYNLPETTFLIIGTGNMANLVTTVLDRSNIKKLYIASHDHQRAMEMAKAWNGEPVDIKNLYSILSEADIIIGGTQGEINLLSEREMGNSKCPRAGFALNVGGPKLFIDFGVPRNFNPELKNYNNVSLYDLDDIKKFTYEGLLKRYQEIPLARQIINQEVEFFNTWINNRKVAPIIEAYWKNLETIKQEELHWLLPKMGDLDEHQHKLIERFVHRILRRVSNPTIEGIKNIAQNIHKTDNAINTAKSILDVDVNIFVPKKKIVVGTRGSKLALTQTNWLIEQLKSIEPSYTFETKIIKTKGDEGNIEVVGAFTSALQKALLAGEIDMAVHSFKDVPTEEVNGLRVLPVTKREDHRDVLISKNHKTFMNLPAGAVVGTGSLRRTAQLKLVRPDLTYKFIQGNVDSRIQQMHDGKYDAVVLAAAGVKRLGMMNQIDEIFENDLMLPAVCQGILAVEIIDKPGYLLELVKKATDLPTKYAADAERAFLISLGGGCNLPIACYADVQDETIHIYGFFANKTGDITYKSSLSGRVEERRILAGKLANFLASKVSSKEKENVAS